MPAAEELTGRECGDLRMPVRPVKLLAQVAGGIVEASRARPAASRAEIRRNATRN